MTSGALQAEHCRARAGKQLEHAIHDVVTLGAYTRDTIVSAEGTRQVDGGGFSYAAHAARLADLRVAAVTRLAREDTAVLAALRTAGVDVFAHESPRSTHLRLEYPTADLDRRTVTATSTADPFRPQHVAGLRARAFVVSASIRGEVPLAVMAALRERPALVALDVQGFVRVASVDGRLGYEPWPEKEAVLAMVDVLKTDAVEARFLTGHSDIRAAARELAGLGPREVVLTSGEGLLVLAEGAFHEAPFLPTSLRGRSGRGDTCIGAYVSRRLSAPPADATRWAAAVTSLKLEAEGPVRRSAEDVRELIRHRYP